MKKKEILEVLKVMLADYENALIWRYDDVDFEYEDFNDFLENNNLDFGFCHWVTHSIVSMKLYPRIIGELLTDYEQTVLSNGFWYLTSIPFNSVEKIKKNSLFPRAQHLKRTIERLENELK